MTLRPEISLSDEAYDALLRSDFAMFVRCLYGEVASQGELVWAPYLDLICSHLGAAVDGRIQNLIITIPPRHLKSICVSVMLPAFFLGRHPNAEVMCVSYGQDLADQFARASLKLMESAAYRRLFDTRLATRRERIQLLRTLAGGARRATSLEGVSTGVGADLLIFDDPQKPGETPSEAIRSASNEALEGTFLSRRNDPAKSRIVIVMQRLHEDDFVGHALQLPLSWTVLNLPAIAEADERIPYHTPIGRRVFVRAEGESLQPQRLPPAELRRIQDSVGEAVWAAQYQQSPTPAGGGLVKLEWFGIYDHPPERFERVVQSWDMANTVREWSDYSVCITFGVLQNRFYLLHVFRARLLYPELKAQLMQLATTWRAEVVVVEDHAAGTQLLQELPTLGFYKTRKSKPTRTKEMRMSNQTGLLASGSVLIPREAPWLAEFLHEMAMFPNGRHDDQVDSLSQALAYMTTLNADGWMVYMREQVAAKRARERGDVDS